MRTALKLAEKGIGSVEPNPAVGCVIVKGGQIVGRGYHKAFGGPHAEVNAITDCRTLSVRPEGATMYVTLEPCCHFGKTQPCTEAIMDAGISRVVVATSDPSEHANGRGFEQLRQAGIDVEVGLCEEEAQRLNAPFLKYVTTGKCWVILKWAQTLDGKLAYTKQTQEQRWISNELSRKDAHKLRRRCGAIVVGINTVLADNPMLVPKPSKGKRPLRVVLDNTLQIPLKSRLLRTTKTCPTLVCSRQSATQSHAKHLERIYKRGAEVLACSDDPNASNLRSLLVELGRRGIQQVLVEGGPNVLASFLKEGLADEICVYIAPKIFGRQGTCSIAEPMAQLIQGAHLEHVDIKAFGDDVRVCGRVVEASAPIEKLVDPLQIPFD